jgi:hypothetical protein
MSLLPLCRSWRRWQSNPLLRPHIAAFLATSPAQHLGMFHSVYHCQNWCAALPTSGTEALSHLVRHFCAGLLPLVLVPTYLHLSSVPFLLLSVPFFARFPSPLFVPPIIIIVTSPVSAPAQCQWKLRNSNLPVPRIPDLLSELFVTFSCEHDRNSVSCSRSTQRNIISSPAVLCIAISNLYWSDIMLRNSKTKTVTLGFCSHFPCLSLF